jgi:TonB family protein
VHPKLASTSLPPGPLLRRRRTLLPTALALLLSTGAASPALAQPQPEAAPAPPAGPRLTKPPALVTFVEAEYPAAEKAAGQTASVVLQLTLDVEGRVTNAQVQESGGPAFDAAAVAAARQFVFSPAEIDGAPAPIRILYKYDFVIHQEEKTTADLTGVVRDRKSKRPLPGVVVELGDTRVVTGEDGRFAFPDQAPGRVAVRLSGEEITAVQTTETLEAGQAVDVVYDVGLAEKAAEGEEADDLEIIVVAPPIKRSVASVQIVADQGRRVPGTQGDVLRVVESLPGVARATVGSGALILWGASPQDSRVYVDGVRLPVLYHVGGLRSVMSTDLVRSLELVPGGYGASFGRAIGGMVLVDSDPLERTGTRGSVGADLLDTSGALQVDLGKRTRVAVFGRRGHLADLIERSNVNVGELFPISRYHDAQARLRHDLGAREFIEVTGLLSSDDVTRTVGSADPASARSDRRELGFHRVWLRYRRELTGGATVTVVPWYGADQERRLDTFGDVRTEVQTRTHLGGLRATWKGNVASWATLSLGLDAEVERHEVERRGSLALPGREGDIRLFGQPPPDRVNFDTWSVVLFSPAPFVETDLSLFDGRVHLLPGLRMEPFFSSASRQTPREGDTPSIGLYDLESVFQPRLAGRATLTDRLSVNAAWGLYRQPAAPQDRSAVFGNPHLPLARAQHYVAGAQVRLTESFSTEVTAFLSRSGATPPAPRPWRRRWRRSAAAAPTAPSCCCARTSRRASSAG